MYDSNTINQQLSRLQQNYEKMEITNYKWTLEQYRTFVLYFVKVVHVWGRERETERQLDRDTNIDRDRDTNKTIFIQATKQYHCCNCIVAFSNHGDMILTVA